MPRLTCGSHKRELSFSSSVINPEAEKHQVPKFRLYEHCLKELSPFVLVKDREILLFSGNTSLLITGRQKNILR